MILYSIVSRRTRKEVGVGFEKELYLGEGAAVVKRSRMLIQWIRVSLKGKASLEMRCKVQMHIPT